MTGDRRSDVPHGATSDGDAVWAPPTTEGGGSGPQLPGYHDLTLIAHGGESRVYRARQEGLDREVAIKVLLVDDPATVARFRRELELTVSLGRQHPNIVTVLATGTVSTGEPCIVMEYHELGSLHDQLQQHGPLPVNEVVAAATAVADALAFAHSRGVLHRDVKPQNVLLLPTSYVLADFGIARFAGAGHTASVERFSYRHASPQVLDGEPPVEGDDVWSLGSTLYTLLDGRPPFASLDADEDTALAYLRRARTEAPRPLRRDDLPGELTDIIARCLRRDREARFVDAAGVHDALAAIRTEARVWAPTARDGDLDVSGRLDGSDRAPVPDPAHDDGPAQPVASAPEPAPRGPAPPVAASALAGAPLKSPTGPDEDATVGPPPRPREPAPPPVQPDEPKGRPNLRVLLFAAIALVLGVALSVGVAMRGRPPPDPAPTATETQGEPVPTWEGELPGGDEPAPEINDPALVGTVDVTDRGSAIEVRWEDPSDGLAQFLIVVTEPEDGELRQYPAGVTEAVLEGLDPDQPRYCVQVLALTSDARGLSEERCVER